MQVYVGQSGRYKPALWGSFVTWCALITFHDPCFQEPSDVSKKFLVSNVVFQKSHQPYVVQIIEKAFNICFQYVSDVFVHYRAVDLSDDVVRPPTLSEPVRAIQKARFIDLSQDLSHDALHQFVFIGGDA